MEEENMSEEQNQEMENSQESQSEEENSNGSDDKNKFNDFSDGGIISSFCQLEGNEFFVEISEEFLENKFNLYGIPKHFSNFR